MNIPLMIIIPVSNQQTQLKDVNNKFKEQQNVQFVLTDISETIMVFVRNVLITVSLVMIERIVSNVKMIIS